MLTVLVGLDCDDCSCAQTGLPHFFLLFLISFILCFLSPCHQLSFIVPIFIFSLFFTSFFYFLTLLFAFSFLYLFCISRLISNNTIDKWHTVKQRTYNYGTEDWIGQGYRIEQFSHELTNLLFTHNNKIFSLNAFTDQNIQKLVLTKPLSPNKKVDLNPKPFCETFITEEFHTNYFFTKELKVRMIHQMIHHWLLSVCLIGLCDLKVWMTSEINFTISTVWVDGYQKGSWVLCWKRYKNMRWL